MTYEDEHNEPKKLRRQRRAQYEFHIDIDGRQLSGEALQYILQIVSQDASIDIPVRELKIPSAQPGLFDYTKDEFDEE